MGYGKRKKKIFSRCIFIAADDYYIYKKLGFQNEIFVPNLYTFEPSDVKSSNLTNKNIVSQDYLKLKFIMILSYKISLF